MGIVAIAGKSGFLEILARNRLSIAYFVLMFLMLVPLKGSIKSTDLNIFVNHKFVEKVPVIPSNGDVQIFVNKFYFVATYNLDLID